jgi:hypothetical protein
MTERAPAQARGAAGDAVDRRRPRWWQRVVPMTGLAVVGGVALVTLPGMGDQIDLSTSRQPQPFVELFLTTSGDTVCAKGPALVRFQVQSHLSDRQALTWTASLDPKGPGKTRRATGELTLAPGQSAIRLVRLKAPGDRSHTVTVRLNDRPEMLRIHCRGGSR